MGVIENWETLLGGYIPSEPCPNVYTMEMIYGDSQIELPKEFSSLPENEYYVHNQYDKGNCVAHSISEMYEIVLKSNDKFKEISYPFIYGNRRMTDNEKAGLVPSEAFLSMYRDGTVDLETFPWDLEVPRIINKFNANYKDLKNKALEMVATDIIRLYTLEEVKRAIYEFGSVSFGTMLFAQFNDIARGKTLYMEKPPRGKYTNIDSSKAKGKHNMLLVGWDDDNEGGHFLCLNSWGSEFGKHGLFYVPYSAINWNTEYDVNYLGEFWAICGIGNYFTRKALYYRNEIPPFDTTENDKWEKQEDGTWKYLDDGKYVSNEIRFINGNLYKFDSNGIMLTNVWHKTENNHWYRFRADGAAVKNNWQKVDGRWYWFDKNCYAVKGYKNINGVDYYFSEKYFGKIKECECLESYK